MLTLSRPAYRVGVLAAKRATNNIKKTSMIIHSPPGPILPPSPIVEYCRYQAQIDNDVYECISEEEFKKNIEHNEAKQQKEREKSDWGAFFLTLAIVLTEIVSIVAIITTGIVFIIAIITYAIN